MLGGIDVSMYSRAVLRGSILQGTKKDVPEKSFDADDIRSPRGPFSSLFSPPRIDSESDAMCILFNAGRHEARTISANFEDIEIVRMEILSSSTRGGAQMWPQTTRSRNAPCSRTACKHPYRRRRRSLEATEWAGMSMAHRRGRKHVVRLRGQTPHFDESK